MFRVFINHSFLGMRDGKQSAQSGSRRFENHKFIFIERAQSPLTLSCRVRPVSAAAASAMSLPFKMIFFCGAVDRTAVPVAPCCKSVMKILGVTQRPQITSLAHGHNGLQLLFDSDICQNELIRHCKTSSCQEQETATFILGFLCAVLEPSMQSRGSHQHVCIGAAAFAVSFVATAWMSKDTRHLHSCQLPV